jgi:hypothetical protein
MTPLDLLWCLAEEYLDGELTATSKKKNDILEFESVVRMTFYRSEENPHPVGLLLLETASSKLRLGRMNVTKYVGADVDLDRASVDDLKRVFSEVFFDYVKKSV